MEVGLFQPPAQKIGIPKLIPAFNTGWSLMWHIVKRADVILVHGQLTNRPMRSESNAEW
jgi:hypothetical protein